MEHKEQERNQATLQADLSTGSITISGPIEFVENYKNEFIDYLKFIKEKCSNEQSFDNEKSSSLPSSVLQVKEDPEIQESAGPVDNQKKKSYITQGIIHKAGDGKIAILSRSIPGKTKAEKTINIALILAYFNDDEKVTNSEITPFCKKFSCFDSNNFSSTFNNRTDLFIKTGKKGSRIWDLTLTINGVNEAEKILDLMGTSNGD